MNGQPFLNTQIAIPLTFMSYNSLNQSRLIVELTLSSESLLYNSSLLFTKSRRILSSSSSNLSRILSFELPLLKKDINPSF